MRTESFNGTRVVSTTELCDRIGIKVSAARIVEAKICAPFAETGTGTYWKEDDVPMIAAGLAADLIKKSIDLQIILNINYPNRF